MTIIWLMLNRGVASELEPADRMQLETWQSSRGTQQQVALRRCIVLAALAGEDNASISLREYLPIPDSIL